MKLIVAIVRPEKLMVLPIEKIYRIRTGESDQDAVTPIPPIDE